MLTQPLAAAAATCRKLKDFCRNVVRGWLLADAPVSVVPSACPPSCPVAAAGEAAELLPSSAVASNVPEGRWKYGLEGCGREVVDEKAVKVVGDTTVEVVRTEDMKAGATSLVIPRGQKQPCDSSSDN